MTAADFLRWALRESKRLDPPPKSDLAKREPIPTDAKKKE